MLAPQLLNDVTITLFPFTLSLSLISRMQPYFERDQGVQEATLYYGEQAQDHRAHLQLLQWQCWGNHHPSVLWACYHVPAILCYGQVVIFIECLGSILLPGTQGPNYSLKVIITLLSTYKTSQLVISTQLSPSCSP